MPKHCEKMQEPCFLVFSDDWGEHPSSCQHIFKHVAQQYRVLWVNTIGMRKPTFSKRDLQKVFLKVGKMIRRNGKKKSSKNLPQLEVCQPFMFPFSNISLVRHVNRFLVTRVLHRRMMALGFTKPILVTTVPNSCDFIGCFGEQRVVYYCVDDFSEWPGLQKSLVREMEAQLVAKADVFIASSEKLFKRLKRNGKPTILLTHGVDLEFFQKLPEKEHSRLAGIPKPRVGYFGLFDERSDLLFLDEVAHLLPEVSLVITGKVETDISRLIKHDNIHFTGPIPYNELPAMVKGWDACMLPYLINELTEAIQPLKLKEYLATGLPVLSTPIAEALKFKKYLNIYQSANDFVEQLEQILQLNAKKISNEQRKKMLCAESWQKKSALFLDRCCKF